jgi:copper ion binding protein
VDKEVLLAPDISCHHCATAIKKAVEKVAGVISVDVDVPTKKVSVSYDPATVSMKAIEEVMAEEGYPVAK